MLRHLANRVNSSKLALQWPKLVNVVLKMAAAEGNFSKGCALCFICVYRSCYTFTIVIVFFAQCYEPQFILILVFVILFLCAAQIERQGLQLISTLHDVLNRYWPTLSCSKSKNCHGGKGLFWEYELCDIIFVVIMNLG
ncbi:uncharacterized protein LOC125212260 isoform X2 [Salvia hispanica]|uniref:uncharacterized protein LOC125212260 isoform X2 n=1 Tax=Salvia hispanica TaxID=49212 RepID=UPI002009D9A5|nr:uncharacterized protein LOC125212260 isoform X2 [Salvia hispanica]